jgi:hypothetical protein
MYYLYIIEMQRTPTINSRHLNKLLDASYAGTNEAEQIGLDNGYLLDKELSNRKHRVYTDKHDNSIIAFTGTRTIGDVITDGLLAVGLGDLTHRFSESTNLVKKVKNKYAHNPIITIGHSLGGTLAEHVNKTGLVDKTITVNKGVGLFGIGKKIKDNQTDIRSKTDAVSILSTTQNGGKHITIPDSFVIKPLRAHGAYNLKKFDKNLHF